MDAPEIDSFPVAELPHRYGIGRSVVYKRLHGLGIHPQQQGRRSYVDGNQLKLLDDLDEHIRRDGTIASFVEQQAEIEPVQPEPSGEIAPTISAIERLAAAFSPTETGRTDPLEAHDQLYKAAERDYRLDAAELGEILGVTAGAISRRGTEFRAKGFRVTYAGREGRRKLYRIARDADSSYLAATEAGTGSRKKEKKKQKKKNY